MPFSASPGDVWKDRSSFELLLPTLFCRGYLVERNSTLSTPPGSIAGVTHEHPPVVFDIMSHSSEWRSNLSNGDFICQALDV